MIDTGASISTLSQNRLPSQYKIKYSENFIIKGVGGNVQVLGSVVLPLYIKNCSIIFHKMYVLPSSCNIGIDGILGSDFLEKYCADISFRNYRLTLKIKNREIWIPLVNGSIADTCSVEPNCAKLCKVRCPSICNSNVYISSAELKPGVFTYDCITEPKNGFMYCYIANTTNALQKICASKLTVRSVHGRSGHPKQQASERPSQQYTANRLNKLKSALQLGHLSIDTRKIILELCTNFQDIFHLEGELLPTTNLCKPKLYLKKGAAPVFCKQYRTPHHYKEEVKKQVQTMVDQNIAQPSVSPFNSPLLLVRKKDNSFRSCLDFRKVNESLADDRFPLPNIVDILDRLGKARVFSSLDLSSGYYQCELDEESRPITAFSTDEGHWELTRLPQGLKTSPAIFSRLMSLAIAGMDGVFHFLDDIICFGEDVASHNKVLEKLFARLRQVKLSLNPKKCNFLQDRLEFLGHEISKDGLRPSPSKTQAVVNYPKPTTADEVLRFVSFCNYYRRFVPNFAKIVKPLNDLLKNNVVFEWTDKCQNAFEQLKIALTTKPVLEFPDFSREFILQTDFSAVSLGAILMNNNGHPVAYASRGLKPAESRYPAIHGELLCIVWAVKFFRAYLAGNHFIVRTDHRPLKYLFSNPTDSSRLTKYRLALQEYDFTVEYVKGSENSAADALSRVKPNNENITSEKLKNMWVGAITRQQSKLATGGPTTTVGKPVQLPNGSDQPEVSELLRKPTDLPELRFFTSENSLPCRCNKAHTELNSPQFKNENAYYCKSNKIIGVKLPKEKNSKLSVAAIEHIGTSLRNICLSNNFHEVVILKNELQILNENIALAKEIIKNIVATVNSKIKKNSKSKFLKLIIIENAKRIDKLEHRKILLKEAHFLPTGGHTGISRMYNTMKLKYFWNSLYKDIQALVNDCEICKKCKYSPLPKSPLMVTTTASQSFEKIFLDLYGPMPETSLGNKYLFTIQCELSKYSEAFPIPDKKAETIAKVLVEEIFLRYGISKQIASDLGTEFCNSVLSAVCKLLNIEKLSSTAYHHESLGALENSHKPLGAFLRSYLPCSGFEWDMLARFFTFSYNSTVHSSLGYCPYELVFGHLPNTPSVLDYSSKIDPIYNVDEYAKSLKYKLQIAQKHARNTLVNTKITRCEKVNSNRKIRQFLPGDLVYLKKEGGTKLENIFEGPYKILELDDKNNVKLKIKNKEILVHKNRIKF